MPTILIVDDLAANRSILSTVLTHRHYDILEAANGAAALELVRSARPDLVITDVLMPVMDGYELVRHMRLESATAGIPVIFHTAHYGEREARELALATGVSWVLTKPAAAAVVLDIVGRALSGQSERAFVVAGAQPDLLNQQHLRLLTDKLSDTTTDLRAANARLRALINIGLDLAAEPDPERLLQNVCAATCDLFCATFVTIAIIDPERRTILRLLTASGVPAREPEYMRWLSIGDAVPPALLPVIAARAPWRTDNPGGDPVRLRLPPLHPETQSLLVVPVASPTLVYGWVSLVCNEGNSFSEEDEHLVMALAGQVGRVYENAWLRELARGQPVELLNAIEGGAPSEAAGG